ncbi:anti-sigma factor [Sphingomonas sp. PAMC26645]|uniref:anti-sigma factor family protein n=1 Tax=Sphingomonas sp. PAMC26645 TaxID=2565555 RepID=UPI00109DE29A|nr:zf-HC2 domain-containing protein [Sphingomonas sp. PAMC26645]QCB43291.1 anti-sigma factor [Sphingomonas sp. PAMC26645]
MTEEDDSVGDDVLHAYVDGLLDARSSARVDRHLANNPEAAARVGAWQADTFALRRALAHKAAEPVPDALSPGRLSPPRRGRRSSGQAIAAGIAAAFLSGTGVGWLGRGPSEPHGLASLGQQAAVAQRVFEHDPHALDRVNGAPVLRVGFDATDRGRVVPAPDLRTAGYDLLGGRVIPTKQGSAALFIYRNHENQRIGVMVRLMIGIDTDAAMRPVPVDGATGYAWSRRGVGFSVVSGQDETRLHDIAEVVRKRTTGEGS